MRTVGRLSAILMTALGAVLASPAGEYAHMLATAAYDGAAAPRPRDEASLGPPASVPSPAAHGRQPQVRRDHPERDKAFAWLLLMLREQRGAR